jgi:Rha family phage regulatory protein
MQQLSFFAAPAAGASSPLTMSSREIAELTGKRHDNVMRDIRVMLVELHGEGGVLSFEDTHTNPQNGQTYPVFMLPKRETLILVSGYSVELRARIIDRWRELEARVAAPATAAPSALQASAGVLFEAVARGVASKAEAFDLLSAIVLAGHPGSVDMLTALNRHQATAPAAGGWDAKAVAAASFAPVPARLAPDSRGDVLIARQPLAQHMGLKPDALTAHLVRLGYLVKSSKPVGNDRHRWVLSPSGRSLGVQNPGVPPLFWRDRASAYLRLVLR